MRLLLLHAYVSVIIVASTLAVLGTGCGVFMEKKPLVVKEPALERILSSEYPDFFDDMACDGLKESILQSIAYLKRVPCSRKFMFGKDSYSASHLTRSFEHFLNFLYTEPAKEELQKYIELNYVIYKSIGTDKKGRVLFTGYFEPVLQGSLNKSDEYRFPVYALPDDLTVIDLSLFSSRYKGERLIGRHTNQKIVPYYDRMEIEEKGIPGNRADKIAWVNDRIDLFFLQIQGSGKIYLDNGDIINVHYHSTNGRPYRSIGKLLIERGEISKDKMSMQAIRAYLNDNPEKIGSVLNYNSSYVFFKTEKEGPLGYLETKLIPGRSIALDRRIFPLSALAFIETQKPLLSSSGNIYTWINFSRFVLNHDTGGAIRGPGRADLFWGNGAYPEIAAGHMQHTGKLYFLILKQDAD